MPQRRQDVIAIYNSLVSDSENEGYLMKYQVTRLPFPVAQFDLFKSGFARLRLPPPCVNSDGSMWATVRAALVGIHGPN